MVKWLGGVTFYRLGSGSRGRGMDDVHGEACGCPSSQRGCLGASTCEGELIGQGTGARRGVERDQLGGVSAGVRPWLATAQCAPVA